MAVSESWVTVSSIGLKTDLSENYPDPAQRKGGEIV